MSGEGDGDLSPTGATEARLVAVPLEDVADVETLWLLLDGNGAYTLVCWADPEGEREIAFLGADGRLHAAGEIPGLRAYLASGQAPPVAGVTDWDDVVRDAEGIDLEPYEDNVVDFDALAGLIGPEMGADEAQQLLDAQGLLVDLGDWLGADEVLELLTQDAVLGRFLVGVLPDLTAGSQAGPIRLAEADLDEVRAEWAEVLHRVVERIDWVDV